MRNLESWDEARLAESIAMVTGTSSVRLDNLSFAVVAEFELGGVLHTDFAPYNKEHLRAAIESRFGVNRWNAVESCVATRQEECDTVAFVGDPWDVTPRGADERINERRCVETVDTKATCQCTCCSGEYCFPELLGEAQSSAGCGMCALACAMKYIPCAAPCSDLPGTCDLGCQRGLDGCTYEPTVLAVAEECNATAGNRCGAADISDPRTAVPNCHSIDGCIYTYMGDPPAAVCIASAAAACDEVYLGFDYSEGQCLGAAGGRLVQDGMLTTPCTYTRRVQPAPERW